MALLRRPREASAQDQSPFVRDDDDDEPDIVKHHAHRQSQSLLLTRDDIPAWYAHNAYHYIRSGYRPVTPSLHLCFQSLTYLHNETVNIYSHLLPALVALVGNYLLFAYFSLSFPQASWYDQLVFHVYLTTSVVCFGTSFVYHTLTCHSARLAHLWVRLDYVAIVFQILGSFVSGIYIGFYCEPQLQRIYWSMVTILLFFCPPLWLQGLQLA